MGVGAGFLEIFLDCTFDVLDSVDVERLGRDNFEDSWWNRESRSPNEDACAPPAILGVDVFAER